MKAKDEIKKRGMVPILEVKDVTLTFGILTVLHGVSFTVPEGSILVMIGPNGAGKSTLLKIISRLIRPQKGDIFFRGKRINRISPDRIASLGITQLFQDIKLFSNMSVIENVMVGCHMRAGAGLLSSGFRTPGARMDERNLFKAAKGYLSMVGLEQKSEASPGSLSWGQQKLVGMARALATGSRLLLLDEPYSGLLKFEVESLNELIINLKHRGITILIVEHLTDILMGIADQVIVLDHGEKIADGTPTEIQNNKRVIDAYLGSEQAVEK